jgi:hypothetical protein
MFPGLVALRIIGGTPLTRERGKIHVDVSLEVSKLVKAHVLILNRVMLVCVPDVAYV